MNREEYLDRVCSQIRFKDVHPQIRRELGSHFDDIVEECLSRDVAVKDTSLEAIRRLGDPVELGRQLEKIHRPRVEWGLLLITMMLVGAGLAVLFSLQHVALLKEQLVFSQTMIVFIPAVIIFSLLVYYDYYRLQELSLLLFLLVLGLLLLLSVFGSRAEGTVPCLYIGSIPVDFISVSPGILAVCLAGIFSRSNWKWNLRGFHIGLALLGLPLTLYLYAASMASVLLYSFLFLVLAWSSGAKPVYSLSFATAIGFPLLTGLFTDPYRMNRLMAFVHPYTSALSDAFYYIQLRNIAARSDLLGYSARVPAGIENYQNNFIFAYVLHSFGWVAGMLLIALALLLLIRLLHNAAQVRERFGFLLITGVTSVFFFQYGWNILMNVGLLPIFAVPLPFISYGSSQIVVQLALLGLVMSVCRRKNIDRNLATSH